MVFASSVESQVPTDSYVTYISADTRQAKLASIYLKNVGSNTIKYKILGARKDSAYADLVDADFTITLQAETTLAGGVEVATPYVYLPASELITAIRLQVANNTGGQANSFTSYCRVSYA